METRQEQSVSKVEQLRDSLAALRIEISTLKRNHEIEKANMAKELLGAQIEFTNGLLRHLESQIFADEVSVRDVKHVPSTVAKWKFRGITSKALSELRALYNAVKQ
jgi:hypothetical protein